MKPNIVDNLNKIVKIGCILLLNLSLLSMASASTNSLHVNFSCDGNHCINSINNANPINLKDHLLKNVASSYLKVTCFYHVTRSSVYSFPITGVKILSGNDLFIAGINNRNNGEVRKGVVEYANISANGEPSSVQLMVGKDYILSTDTMYYQGGDSPDLLTAAHAGQGAYNASCNVYLLHPKMLESNNLVVQMHKNTSNHPHQPCLYFSGSASGSHMGHVNYEQSSNGRLAFTIRRGEYLRVQNCEGHSGGGQALQINYASNSIPGYARTIAVDLEQHGKFNALGHQIKRSASGTINANYSPF